MYINNLNNQRNIALDEVFQFYSRIPRTEVDITIDDNFDPNKFAHPEKTLFYIPDHITMVSFVGSFIHIIREVQDDLDCPTEETVELHFAKIGERLVKYVSSLPKTVHTVCFNFTRRDESLYGVNPWYIMDALINAIRSLPKNVIELRLEIYGIDDNALFKAIPETVKNLIIYNMGSQKLSRCLPLVKSGVTQIGLTSNQLANHSSAQIGSLWVHLPRNLILLDLKSNRLFTKTPEDFRIIFANLPDRLQTLGLSDNALLESTNSPADIATILAMIPASVSMLDIGDNLFLAMPPEYLDLIFCNLPPTVEDLRLSEKNLFGNERMPILPADVATQFTLLPPTIKTLTLSDSNLFGLSIDDFLIVISQLPETVKTLDLGTNHLFSKTLEELVQLFSGIPPHIQKLILKNNRLVSLELSVLQRILESLPPTIQEIDISQNGFHSLCRSEFNKLVEIIPDNKRIVFDKDQFAKRHDGLVISYTGKSNAFFKVEQSVRSTRASANLHLVLMQLMQIKSMPKDSVILIFSFLFDAKKNDLSYFSSKMEMVTISAKPPELITLTMQAQCLEAVQKRLALLKPDDVILDLSRCGLNRLDANHSSRILPNLPEKVRCISLRGNGLRHQEFSQVLFKLLQDLPQQITYLDLSENGFELYNYEQLRSLFANIAPSVKHITLSREEALSPSTHLTRIYWHNFYERRIAAIPTLIQKARYLLDDYTQGDSFIWRVITGSWNRHHINQVAKIVRLIDYGIITNTTDLAGALDNIPLKNDAGTLAIRINFIMKIIHEHQSTVLENRTLTTLEGAEEEKSESTVTLR